MIDKILQVIYKHASYFFAFTGLLLSLAHYVAARQVIGNRILNIGVVLVICIQVGGGFVFGLAVQKLYEVANTDYLTGLNNRKVFYRELDELFEQTKHKNKDLSLIMMDLDRFKSINDTYGHIIGDKVLIHLSEVLKKDIRKGDILSRVGGEEFALLLPDTNLEEATRVAERIRVTFQEEDIPYINEEVTVSLGVAYCAEGVCKQSLIQLADDAMYKAKKERNKVVSK